MLGTYWTIEDIQAMTDAQKEPSRERPTEFIYPLSCIIEPKMPEILKKSAGSKWGIDPPKWAKQGDFEEMYDWNAEKFLRFVGQMVERKAPTGSRAL